VVPIAAGATIEKGIGGDIVSVNEALKVPFAKGFSEIDTTENKQRGCASQNLGSYFGSKGDTGLRLATRKKYFTRGRAEKHIVSGGPFEVGPPRQPIGVPCADCEIFQVGRRAAAVFEIESNHNRLIGIHPLDAEVARENVWSILVGEFNCCAPQRESEEGDKNGSGSGRGIAILVNDVNGAPNADSGSIGAERVSGGEFAFASSLLAAVWFALQALNDDAVPRIQIGHSASSRPPKIAA